MKRGIKKWYNKLLTQLLTLLGFGSTFTFMACYGPPPDELDYLEVNPDSVVVSRTIVEPTDSAIASQALPARQQPK